jgi:hypothetical protein
MENKSGQDVPANKFRLQSVSCRQTKGTYGFPEQNVNSIVFIICLHILI